MLGGNVPHELHKMTASTTAPGEAMAARSFHAQPTETIDTADLKSISLLYPAIIPVPSCPINPPSLPAKPRPAGIVEADLDTSILGASLPLSLSLPLQHKPPANKCNVMILKVTRIRLAIVGARLLLATVSGSKFVDSISSCSSYWNLVLKLRSVELFDDEKEHRSQQKLQ